MNEIRLNKISIGDELGVSPYTIANWIKTGLIPPPDTPQGAYSKPAFSFIINKIRNDSSRLNSRANRSLAKEKYLSYLGISDKSRRKQLEDLVTDFEMSGLSVSDGVLALAIAMLRSNNLLACRQNKRRPSRLETLVSKWLSESVNSGAVKKLFAHHFIANYDDDLLGAFYQSIQSISQKSSTGSYYTPKELLEDIRIQSDKTILDPCCGSGGVFLKTLGKDHDTSKIFAGDTDDIALRICFVNLSMFFDNPNIKAVIIKRDVIFGEKYEESFDYIITNPPWGSSLTKVEKRDITSLYPELETTEVFSIALSNCAELLANKGKLYFFLPYAFLNVAQHRKIREKILNLDGQISISLLGSAFKGVLSEGILLRIEKKQAEQSINIFGRTGNSYNIEKKHITPPDFFIPADSDNNDLSLIKKMYEPEHITLRRDAIFAMGIVTGNNTRYLLSRQTETSEAIFRGKDIQPFAYSEAMCFIEFDPKKYHQVSPIEYYRQKKIAYRFISDRLVCLLDSSSSLLLNSANLFICESYPMETIVCLFNSHIYSFIYQKMFHSSKVLKSHLQQLPLPVLSPAKHDMFYALYQNILTGKATQDDIDALICESFSLSGKQYAYMCESVDKKRKRF